jgi:hypothetical protein
LFVNNFFSPLIFHVFLLLFGHLNLIVSPRKRRVGVLPQLLIGFAQANAMAKKDPQTERLGDVLDKSLKRLELAPRLDEYGVWPVWNDVVGNPIARNAQPEKIRNGTLFVKVTSPVWMQQLQFMKELITEKLNQRVGSPVVKNIFFVVGRVESDEAEAESQPAARSEPEPREPAIDEEFLKSLTDPEIRQAFKRLLRSHARRKLKNET